MRMRCILLAAVVLGLAACGGSDAAPTTGPVETTTTPSDDTGDAACDDQFFIGELSRIEADGHAAVARGGPEMVDAIAVQRVSNTAYTIYLADHQIDRTLLGETLEAPEGQVLVTFAIDQGEGIVVGEPTNNTPNSHPFVIIDSGGGAIDSALGHNDHFIIVTGLSTDRICFEIRYHDDVKTVIGVVSAPIELAL